MCCPASHSVNKPLLPREGYETTSKRGESFVSFLLIVVAMSSGGSLRVDGEDNVASRAMFDVHE